MVDSDSSDRLAIFTAHLHLTHITAKLKGEHSAFAVQKTIC